MTQRMIFLQGAALASSLVHVLIDARIGLFGAGASMTFMQFLAFLVTAALYGWWLAPLAVGIWGTRAAILSLALISGIWTALANGVVGIAACPIPCAGAAPYQDVAHVASAVIGSAAAWYAWRVYRRTAGPITPVRTLVPTAGLLFLAIATSAAATLT